MAERILLCIEPDSATVRDSQRACALRVRVESIPNGEDAIEWGAHQHARAHHPVRRAAQGRLRDLQQAQAQPEPARGAADPDLVGGDAGDVRAAQEAQVARRRVPAEAARHRGAPGQGRPAWCGLRSAADGRRRDPRARRRATSCIADDERRRRSSRRRRDEADEARTSRPRSRHRRSPEPAIAERRRDTVAAARAGAAGRARASPFEGEKFDPETQAAFAALRPARPRDGQPRRRRRHGRPAHPVVATTTCRRPSAGRAPPTTVGDASADPRGACGRARRRRRRHRAGPTTTGATSGTDAAAAGDRAVDLRATTCSTCRPSPEDVEHRSTSRCTSRRRSAPAMVRRRRARARGRGAQRRAARRASRSLENERQTLRKELEEARERFNADGDVLEGARVPGPARDHQQEGKGHPRPARRRWTRRSGRSSTTRTRSASWIGRGAIWRRRRSASSAAWWPPTRRSPSWRWTAREVGRAREGAEGAARRRARGAAQGARRGRGHQASAWRRTRRARRGEIERLRAELEATARETGGGATAPSWPGSSDEQAQATPPSKAARQAELARIDARAQGRGRGAAAAARRGAGGGERAAARPRWRKLRARAREGDRRRASEEQAAAAGLGAAGLRGADRGRRSATTATRSWACGAATRRSWPPPRSAASATSPSRSSGASPSWRRPRAGAAPSCRRATRSTTRASPRSSAGT